MYLDMQCDERRKDGQYLRDMYEIGQRNRDKSINFHLSE
jgi:hypothetical protein